MRGEIIFDIFIPLFLFYKIARNVYKNMPFNNRERIIAFYERNTYF